MGMDLRNVESDEYFNVPSWAWGTLLEVAQLYGWNPQGTQFLYPVLEDVDGTHFEEDKARWKGRYDFNEGQVVTTSDGAELARALDQALADGFMKLFGDAPGEGRKRCHDFDWGMNFIHDILEQSGATVIPAFPPQDEGRQDPETRRLRGAESGKFVRAFIAYCRKGAFRIF